MCDLTPDLRYASKTGIGNYHCDRRSVFPGKPVSYLLTGIKLSGLTPVTAIIYPMIETAPRKVPGEDIALSPHTKQAVELFIARLRGLEKQHNPDYYRNVKTDSVGITQAGNFKRHFVKTGLILRQEKRK